VRREEADRVGVGAVLLRAQVRALRGFVVVERGVRGGDAEEGVGVEVAEEGLRDEGARGGGGGGDVEGAAG
jgi:hypothetical protein